ncbi:hypothetical protein J4Q44_G00310610, partial [Coregonus suidteri]
TFLINIIFIDETYSEGLNRNRQSSMMEGFTLHSCSRQRPSSFLLSGHGFPRCRSDTCRSLLEKKNRRRQVSD